jgi:Clp amino terminal domain, pathogenicity island component
MFERYTEKARRAVFSARYEASHSGSPAIEDHHLLLGIFREDRRAFRWIPEAQSLEVIRQQVESWISPGPKIPPSVDLPLSDAAKRVLRRAQDEADRMNSKPIGTKHLFLALLGEADSRIGKFLLEIGGDAEKFGSQYADEPTEEATPSSFDRVRKRGLPVLPTTSIHGQQHPLPVALAVANRLRRQPFHWREPPWKPRDVVRERKTGKLSLDLRLAEDATHFELEKSGWKIDHCVVCNWELFEAADRPEHGNGYTNGRDWICTECFERFWDRPDFISGAFSEIT